MSNLEKLTAALAACTQQWTSLDDEALDAAFKALEALK